MHFKSAVSTEANSEKAVEAIASGVQEGMEGKKTDLAFLFVSAHHRQNIEKMAASLRKILQPGILLGCTAEGVIGTGQEVEGQPAASLWAAHLPGVAMTPLHLTFREEKGGVVTEGWPQEASSAHRNPSFLLLCEPYSTPGAELIDFLYRKHPGAPAVGGMASGGMDYGQNKLIFNDRILSEGAVGVVMSGPISIQAVVSQGCRPIGERHMITRSEDNKIFELGGRSALQCLQDAYADLTPEEQTAAQRGGLQVGYAIDEHKSQFERGDFLIRNLVGADQGTGSIAIADLVKEGQTVQFHLRDRDIASEDLEWQLAAHKVHQETQMASGALLFSCNGRGKKFFGVPHHDAEILRKYVGEIPVAGFFAQGEIGPVGGHNFLHGYTASLALFTHSPEQTS